MKNILLAFCVAATLSACEKPEEIIEQLPPPTPYNVHFEVECDTCIVYYAVNAFGNTVADSCFGFYEHDTIMYLGDGANITAMDNDYISDSVTVKLFVNDSLAATDWEYGIPGVDFLFASATFVLQ